MSIYLGVLSSHGKISVEGRILRPGPAPPPCSQRRARGRADGRGQRRRGGEERRASSAGPARAPWPTSPRPRGARQRRDGARGCLTAGREARGRGATGRPCASPAWAGAGRRGRVPALAPRPRPFQAAAHRGRRRAGRGRGAARAPRTLFQGGGRSARGGAAEPATTGAAESRGVGGGRAMARAAQCL